MCALLTYSGDPSPVLWLMTVVQQHCLVAGDTFQFKQTLSMHITEEVNFRVVKIATVCSDKYQLLVVGVDFYAMAANSKHWDGSSLLLLFTKVMVPCPTMPQHVR